MSQALGVTSLGQLCGTGWVERSHAHLTLNFLIYSCALVLLMISMQNSSLCAVKFRRTRTRKRGETPCKRNGENKGRIVLQRGVWTVFSWFPLVYYHLSLCSGPVWWRLLQMLWLFRWLPAQWFSTLWIQTSGVNTVTVYTNAKAGLFLVLLLLQWSPSGPVLWVHPLWLARLCCADPCDLNCILLERGGNSYQKGKPNQSFWRQIVIIKCFWYCFSSA